METVPSVTSPAVGGNLALTAIGGNISLSEEHIGITISVQACVCMEWLGVTVGETSDACAS